MRPSISVRKCVDETRSEAGGCKSGQFAIRAKALPGNPFDVDTLARTVQASERIVGNEIDRLHADAGCRRHNSPNKFKASPQAVAPPHAVNQTRHAPPRRNRTPATSRTSIG
jgi:hypothetical protein